MHLFVVFAALSSFAQSLPNRKWVLSKSKDQIEVYTQPNDNGMVFIQGRMDLQTDVWSCINLIRDHRKTPKWVDRVVFFDRIRAEGDSVWCTYAELSVPWPFANKDLTNRNRLVRIGSGHYQIVCVSEPELIPEKEGKVRVQHSLAIWEFKQVTPKKTQVVYTLQAGPEKFIPGWLLQKLVIQTMFNTFENMRKQF